MASSKLVTYVLILWAVEIVSVYLIDCSADTHTLFLLMTHISDWGRQSWLDALSLSAAALTAAGAFALSYFTSSDLGIFSPLAISFFALGAGPIVRIWNLIGEAATGLFGSSVSTFIQLLIVSPLGLAYIMAVIGWWRGKEA